MYKENSVGVVIPAYNEEALIGNTLDSIPEYIDKIYVVNDCSTDKTQEIIEHYALKDKRISLINHTVNSGVGVAIISGYKAACNDEVAVAVVMAGDNQMDPQYLPSLIDPIVDNQADYTKGNRLISSEFRKGMSTWRTWGNSILTLFTKIASGYWNLMDPQNGYAAISRNALETIPLNSIYPRYGYCNDLLVKLNVYGFRVKDVVIPARYGDEKSKIRYHSYIPKVSWLLFKDFFWRLKMKYILLSFHPLVFFYLFGLILTPLGLLAGIYSIYFVLIEEGPLFIRATLSLLIFILGIQFLFFAMLFDMQMNSDLMPGNHLRKK